MRSESARDVSTIGTRAPSTMPAPSALARKVEILGQHVAGLEVRHDQDLRPAGDLRTDALDPGRLRVDRVVERERTVEKAAGDLPAVRHLAERGRLDGRRDLRRHGLDRRQDRDPGGVPKPTCVNRSIAF